MFLFHKANSLPGKIEVICQNLFNLKIMRINIIVHLPASASLVPENQVEIWQQKKNTHTHTHTHTYIYRTINLSVICEQKMVLWKGSQETMIPLEIKTAIKHQNNDDNWE